MCGHAIRVGQSLGLHVNSTQDTKLSDVQRQLRSRLWSVTICLDA